VNHWPTWTCGLRSHPNGATEALNGLIQTIKRKSRGFRTFEYFRTMIYLVASGLPFNRPNPFPVTHTNSP